jgi:IS30 family transposase
MAEHVRFIITTRVQVHFCDPQSLWQQSANINPNGLLPQNLQRGAEPTTFKRRDLDDFARELDERPREMLDGRTRAQHSPEVQRTTSGSPARGAATQ